MKWRLFAAFAGLVAMVLLAQDIPLASYLRETEHDRVLAGLERDAFIIAGNSEDLLSGEDDGVDEAAAAERLQASLQQYAVDGGRVVVVDTDARILASSDPNDAPGDSFARPEIAQALGGEPAEGQRDSQAVRWCTWPSR